MKSKSKETIIKAPLYFILLSVWLVSIGLSVFILYFTSRSNGILMVNKYVIAISSKAIVLYICLVIIPVITSYLLKYSLKKVYKEKIFDKFEIMLMLKNFVTLFLVVILLNLLINW